MRSPLSQPTPLSGCRSVTSTSAAASACRRPAGPPPPVTAALFTPGDSEQDWLQAGQALHRLLLGAATEWVFARLNTQPLEDPLTRTLIKEGLELPGAPQMLLALGISRTAHATARRPAADLIGP